MTNYINPRPEKQSKNNLMGLNSEMMIAMTQEGKI